MEALLDIDIPTVVEHKTNLFNQFDVVSITLSEPNETDGRRTFSITPEVFMEEYREYINPMQLEINRLLAENKKLKEKLKPVRKTRKRLTTGEKTDIRKDILAGANNLSIAKEYDCSDTVISKMRCELRRAGEDV